MKSPKQSLHFWVFLAFLSLEVFPAALKMCLGEEITAAQWRMDLKCLARQMPLRHKNLYHTISKKQFEDKETDLYKRLPGMSEAEAKVGFLRIVTSIGDAHTWISSMVVNTARQNPVLKVILDLRHNGGGNNQVMNPLLKALKRDPLKSARLYAITGCRTFSSGTWAACRLKSECMAVVVGEPSRQKLHAYGDTRPFTLPQSGLTVGYAVKFFDFVSEKDNLLVPDLPVPLKAEDYFAGRDAALERILAD